MKHQLPDGRWLMASYEELYAFFQENKIIGKVIRDIRPFALNYCIGNLDEVEEVLNTKTQCAIRTDEQICIVFTDNTTLEVEFSGDGPIILGYNTAELSAYPQYNGSCYTLSTMFRHCIGKKITEIVFEKTVGRMLFPRYRGIDMSGDDDGVKQLCFFLDDGSYLLAEGNIDYFAFCHKVSPQEHKIVATGALLRELDPKQFPFIKNLERAGFVTMRSRQKALNQAILRDMKPIWKIRRLYFRFNGRNQECSYAVTVRKDTAASFAERNSRFYECLQKNLGYGETLLCENQCYTVVGEFYRLTYVLEGYKKHPNQIGYVEAGEPRVSLLHRMSAEEAFRWLKYREEKDREFVFSQMHFPKLVQEYPNPSHRLIECVKIVKQHLV